MRCAASVVPTDIVKVGGYLWWAYIWAVKAIGGCELSFVREQAELQKNYIRGVCVGIALWTLRSQ